MTVQPFDADPRAIARYLGLNPSDPKSHAVTAVCARYGLDPVLKHVIVLPQGGVYLTRDGLLHIAHTSGQLDGIVLEETGENDVEWWATVSVHRKDMSHPFKYQGRYPKAGKNTQYGPEMAIKSAESHALRRAFAVTGLPTADEIQPARTAQPRSIPHHAAPTMPDADFETGEIIEAETAE